MEHRSLAARGSPIEKEQTTWSVVGETEGILLD